MYRLVIESELADLSFLSECSEEGVCFTFLQSTTTLH